MPIFPQAWIQVFALEAWHPVRSQSPCMLLRSAALEYVPLFAKRRRRSPLIRMPNLATLAAIDSGRPSHHFCFRISTRSITFPILHSP